MNVSRDVDAPPPTRRAWGILVLLLFTVAVIEAVCIALDLVPWRERPTTLVALGALIGSAFDLIAVKIARRRFTRAVASEDAAAMRSYVARLHVLRPFAAPRAKALRRLIEAASYAIEDRHDLARSIRPSDLLPVEAAQLLTIVAQETALAGDIEAGLAIARQAHAAPCAMNQEQRAVVESTLGMVEHLAGLHELALSHLEPIRDTFKLKVAAAEVRYYLGETYRALGREDDARRAYRAAIDEAPDSKFGRRAAARLV